MPDTTASLLPVLGPGELADARLNALPTGHGDASRPLEILDAGYGWMWIWGLSGMEFRLTGVDTDAAALEERKATVGDLDVAVCADLRTF